MPQDPTPDTKPLYAALAFICATLLTTVPILLHLHLPLVDLPNHIARHAISTAPAGPLSDYYLYELKLVPNAAVDLAWIAFGADMDPTRFSQLTMAFYCTALIGATMLLSRFVHGIWSPWPAAAALVAYNACFFWGFQNFLVSAPFAILGLTLWLWSERLPILQRLVILSPFVLLLYLMHFFAFAALAVATFGREVQRIIEARGDWKPTFARAILLAIPYLVPILWLVSDVLFGPESPAGNRTEFGSLQSRIMVFASISAGTYQGLTATLNITGWAIVVAAALLVLTLARPIFAKITVAPQMGGPLIALTIAALLSPAWLNGVAFVHVRFGFIVVALLFAATRWHDLSPAKARLLTLVVLSLLLVRGIGFERYAATHASEVQDFISVTENVPAGERLLPAYAHKQPFQDFRLWHIAANAVTYQDVFIPTLFQGVHALQVKPEWSKHAIAAGAPAPVRFLDDATVRPFSELEFIWDWQTKYTYLVMMDRNLTGLDAYETLRPVASQGRFTLYRIASPG